MSDKKKKYEPPAVIDVHVAYTQAVGQSVCSLGSRAMSDCMAGHQPVSACNHGSAQYFQQCHDGWSNDYRCITGSIPGGTGCTTGSKP